MVLEQTKNNIINLSAHRFSKANSPSGKPNERIRGRNSKEFAEVLLFPPTSSSKTSQETLSFPAISSASVKTQPLSADTKPFFSRNTPCLGQTELENLKNKYYAAKQISLAMLARKDDLLAHYKPHLDRLKENLNFAESRIGVKSMVYSSSPMNLASVKSSISA